MSSYNVGYGITPLTSSVIKNFYTDVVNVIASVGGSPSGIGLIAVSTTGSNFGGNGQILNPLYLNDVITVTDVHTNNLSASGQVTASYVNIANNLSSSKITASCYYGDGNKITNLTASNITNFTVDVRSQLTGNNYVVYEKSIGAFTLRYTGSLLGTTPLVLGTTSSVICGLSALTSSVANISILTSSYQTVTGFLTASSITGTYTGSAAGLYNLTASGVSNFTSDVRGQFSAGVNLNYSNGVYSLNDAIDLSSVTASLKGDGSQVTNITASNITNFTNDVRAQLNAGQNINFTTGTIAFSGVLPVVNGGTGLSSAGAVANILVSDGTGLVSRTLSQDVTITSTGVATTKGLYTNPLRSPAVTAPSPGDFLKWGGTDWFPAPVAATVAIGSLTLTSDAPQTITANGQTILPTTSYWRLNSAGNFNAGNINYVGVTLGQILFIQVPIGQAGSVTFNKGPNLALGSNTRKISAGGSLQLIYDGVRWIEMFFNTSTST